MSDILEEHVDTVRTRLKARGLSRMELQEEYRSRLNTATDTTLSTNAQAMATAEAKMLHDWIADTAPPPMTPAEQAQQYREQGRHTLAESIEYGLKVQAQQDKLSQSRNELATLGDDVFAERKRSLLTQEIDSLEQGIIKMQRETPFHQRAAEQKQITDESVQTVAKASTDLQAGHITEDQFQAIEAKASQDTLAARDLTTDAGAA